MTKQKNKYPVEQTICVDDCICCFCGHKFEGTKAINGDLDKQTVKCPKCEKEMYVGMSVEYTCTVID